MPVTILVRAVHPHAPFRPPNKAMTKGRSSRSGAWTKGAAPSDQLRREVTRRGDELLARNFEPLLAHETVMRKGGFNYAVALFSEWRGQSFYLCVRYRTPRPTEEFVVREHAAGVRGPGSLPLGLFSAH